MNMKSKASNKKTILIITAASIAFSFQFCIRLLCLIILIPIILSFFIFPTDFLVTYAISEKVVENDIEYEVSPLFKMARVETIVLTEEETNYEIMIPERLEDGTRVQGFGHVTKGQEYFNFEIKNKKIISHSEYSKDYFVREDFPQEMRNYYVTIIIGEKLKKADCMLGINYSVIRFKDTNELICINVDYQVSPDNKYYYSQDGVLYEK